MEWQRERRGVDSAGCCLVGVTGDPEKVTQPRGHRKFWRAGFGQKAARAKGYVGG
jgi:hypothetical protein